MKIIAIVIARPTFNPEEEDDYSFDYEGKFLYLDCLWSPNNLKLVSLALIKRFGVKRVVCWHRWRGSQRLRQSKAEKLLTRILP